MGQADLEINRKTRSVFVRHWIDLGHISMRSVNGRVSVRGNLVRIFGHKEELTSTSLDNIFKEIKRIPGVKGVTPTLDNWSNEGGAWHSTNQNENKKKPKGPSASPGQQSTYTIDEE